MIVDGVSRLATPDLYHVLEITRRIPGTRKSRRKKITCKAEIGDRLHRRLK